MAIETKKMTAPLFSKGKFTLVMMTTFFMSCLSFDMEALRSGYYNSTTRRNL